MRHDAFTLIECLVALAIVAVLLTIAVPSYQQYRVRTYRVDAQTTLFKAAAALEGYFYRQRTFATATIATGNIKTDILDDALTEHQSYRISLHQQSDTRYLLWATAQGVQAEADAPCYIYTLDNQGRKGNRSKTGAQASQQEWRQCWR